MTTHATPTRSGLVFLTLLLFIVIGGSFSEEVLSQIGRFTAQDPGVRKGPPGAGGALQGIASGSMEQRV